MCASVCNVLSVYERNSVFFVSVCNVLSVYERYSVCAHRSVLS